ncbi:hypothetical protein DAPK24_023330 [Pichia kluyveri]|uniref:Uncharacterized protein n=1 Tax=Pichia kluyveri TaxID=36015 RepID=A0AAV5R3I6_PICKL|nr:hypothetical protein DAPK24_023330 [Pichia kluyveri]
MGKNYSAAPKLSKGFNYPKYYATVKHNEIGQLLYRNLDQNSRNSDAHDKDNVQKRMSLNRK